MGSPARSERRVAWRIAAAALVLASAVLQYLASMQRWVEAASTWTPTDRLVEDSLFDYFHPADPWENVGTAAQTFGAGYLLLALGVLAIGRASPDRSTLALVACRIVAASFALVGLHALISGLLGAPTVLQSTPLQLLRGLVEFVALVFLAASGARTSITTSLTWLLLIGATLLGYLVSTFLIAPAVTGYQSFDTTPHTETVVAAWTAAAGVALLLGLLPRPRRTARRG